MPPSAKVRLLPGALAMEDAKLCIAQYKPYSFYSQSTKAPRRGRAARSLLTPANFRADLSTGRSANAFAGSVGHSDGDGDDGGGGGGGSKYPRGSSNNNPFDSKRRAKPKAADFTRVPKGLEVAGRLDAESTGLLIW